MDDIRDSFSKLTTDIIYRITGNKQRADEALAGECGERADISGSVPRPEPHVVTSSDHERRGDGSSANDENVGPSTAVDEKKSGRGPTVSSSAKLLLRGVRDSADAFGPLKSVAGGLCFILDNCEVRLPPHLLSATLIDRSAHRGEQTNNRIVGPSGQSPCRSAL